MKRYLILLLVSLALKANLYGQAADSDFRFSYALLPRGNQTAILPDGTLTFPDTTANIQNPNLSQTSSATFVITNRGQISGTVNNISASAGPFKVSGVPLLPVVLQPNQMLSFNIDFQPSQLGRVSGTLRIDLIRPINFTLDGKGIGASLAYEFTVGSTTQTVLPNDTLNLPQANVGDRTSATLRVRNTGNSDAVINTLASSHATFPLDNVPFLPVTLQAGSSIAFGINFAPTQAGTLTASLKVGDATFSLSGIAVGAVLTYTATVGSATSTLAPNGTIIFTLTRVGFSSTAQLQITNSGNTAAFINSISVSGPATGVFGLRDLPVLPARVDTGASLSFGLAFAPVVLGQATGTLKIDSATFNLSGVGDTPPALPGVSFSGSGTVVDPAQQIGVGIALDNPYPVQLEGKLVLTFTSSADVFNDDQAIAFSSGGRTVNFIVPANSRMAVFGLNDTQIRLQTGTVAGNITLVATFATSAGGINLTATNAPATSIAVRSSSPRISSVQLVARSAGSFSVAITGYSPTRSLNTMDFTFTPYEDPTNKGLKLETITASLTVSGPMTVWYLSAQSQPFGSLFTATVTFNVRGNIEAIQSLGISMSNSIGTSNSRIVPLR